MTDKTKLLVIEDDPPITRFMRTGLSEAGYELLLATTGAEGLEIFQQSHIDVLLLDLGLPGGIDGFQVLRQIRETSNVPIIIVTARELEESKVEGLELGADDYLTKPFGIKELVARIQAVLRRAGWSTGRPTDPIEIKVAAIRMDFTQHRVFVKDNEVHLTPTEFDLLRVLILDPGKVLLHGDLLSEVWGDEYRNDLAILRVNISRLRQKLEDDPHQPKYILTISGVGYTFTGE
jgi:DNA-binding response OmpR family regulator